MPEAEVETQALEEGELVSDWVGHAVGVGVPEVTPVVVAEVEAVAEAELVLLVLVVEDPVVEAEAVELLLAEVEEEAVAVAVGEEVVLPLGVLVTLGQPEPVEKGVAEEVTVAEEVSVTVAV